MFKYISKKLIFLPQLQTFDLIWQFGLLHTYILHASKYLRTFVSVIEFSIIVEILLAMHIQFAHLINDEFQPMQNCNILQLWHQFSVTNIFPFLHISLNLVAVHSIILLQCTTRNQLYSYKFASLSQGLNIFPILISLNLIAVSFIIHFVSTKIGYILIYCFVFLSFFNGMYNLNDIKRLICLY